MTKTLHLAVITLALFALSARQVRAQAPTIAGICENASTYCSTLSISYWWSIYGVNFPVGSNTTVIYRYPVIFPGVPGAPFGIDFSDITSGDLWQQPHWYNSSTQINFKPIFENKGGGFFVWNNGLYPVTNASSVQVCALVGFTCGVGNVVYFTTTVGLH